MKLKSSQSNHLPILPTSFFRRRHFNFLLLGLLFQIFLSGRTQGSCSHPWALPPCSLPISWPPTSFQPSNSQLTTFGQTSPCLWLTHAHTWLWDTCRNLRKPRLRGRSLSFAAVVIFNCELGNNSLCCSPFTGRTVTRSLPMTTFDNWFLVRPSFPLKPSGDFLLAML